MKVFVLKGILGGLHGRSHGSRREVMVFLTESTAFCRRMKTYPWEVIRDAAQRGLILLGKNLANNGRFFNNMTSLYDGSYAAFKIRFQWLFLSSVLVLILSVISIVLYIFLMKGICPPFLPFSHFPEIPPLFSFLNWSFENLLPILPKSLRLFLLLDFPALVTLEGGALSLSFSTVMDAHLSHSQFSVLSESFRPCSGGCLLAACPRHCSILAPR